MTRERKRVLILDDDVDFGEFVQDVVEGAGCEGLLLTRSNQFKKAFVRFDPGVIVLDVTMPEIDGIELVQWLAEQHCNAQIIIASGANPIFISAAQRLGEINGLARPTILQKPFGAEKLRALVS